MEHNYWPFLQNSNRPLTFYNQFQLKMAQNCLNFVLYLGGCQNYMDLYVTSGGNSQKLSQERGLKKICMGALENSWATIH